MSNIEEGIFHRTRLLVGPSVMDVLSSARVIIFGVGGVGSWCAESLVRSGIRHLTLLIPTASASPMSIGSSWPPPPRWGR